MSSKKPNIVFFFWDNLGWGEVGCYGGGILRGAPTPRIDSLAADGMKLLNFNVEAQCTPSRSALLTGRHPLRSGTQTVPITGGPDGLTRWEITMAQSLSDAGYATGMWGKWHLGSDVENRSPVDFGFDEAMWSPRTADEVFWTMQSYFPDGPVTATPYAGEMQVPMEPQTIYSRKKGEDAVPVGTYDAEFRAGFDRKITEERDRLHHACQERRQAVLRLPALHPGAHPADPGPGVRRQHEARQLRGPADPDGRLHGTHPRHTRGTGSGRGHHRGLGVGQRGRPQLPHAGDRPRPAGGSWQGSSGPWRGGYFTSLEGSNRAPCLVRWPGHVPAGKVSNEMVHLVDMFPTLAKVAGAEVPTDRVIDGMDMGEFLLGDAKESGRNTVLCIQGNRLQAIKWRQWKAHLFQQDGFMSTFSPLNMPRLYNLEWDPREEHEVDFPHGWTVHPMAAAAGVFLSTLAKEPPIKPGTPDPYVPPKPGELRPEEHIQLGVITQFVTTLVKSHDALPQPHHGLDHPTG